jgi:hypothetical protein
MFETERKTESMFVANGMLRTAMAIALVSIVAGCVTSESATSQSAGRSAQARSARGAPGLVILGTAY